MLGQKANEQFVEFEISGKVEVGGRRRRGDFPAAGKETTPINPMLNIWIANDPDR